MRPNQIVILFSILTGKVVTSLSTNLDRVRIHHRYSTDDRHDPPLPIVILNPVSLSPMPNPSTRPTYGQQKHSSRPTYKRKIQSSRPTYSKRKETTTPTLRPTFRRKKTSSRPSLLRNRNATPTLRPTFRRKKRTRAPTLRPSFSRKKTTRPSVFRKETNMPTMRPTLSQKKTSRPSSFRNETTVPTMGFTFSRKKTSRPSVFRKETTTPTFGHTLSRKKTTPPSLIRKETTMPTLRPTVGRKKTTSPSIIHKDTTLPTMRSTFTTSRKKTTRPSLLRKDTTLPTLGPTFSQKKTTRPSAFHKETAAPTIGSTFGRTNTTHPSAIHKETAVPTLGPTLSRKTTTPPSVFRKETTMQTIRPTVGRKKSTRPSSLREETNVPTLRLTISRKKTTRPSAFRKDTTVPTLGPTLSRTKTSHPSAFLKVTTIPTLGLTLSRKKSTRPSAFQKETTVPTMRSTFTTSRKNTSRPTINPSNKGSAILLSNPTTSPKIHHSKGPSNTPSLSPIEKDWTTYTAKPSSQHLTNASLTDRPKPTIQPSVRRIPASIEPWVSPSSSPVANPFSRTSASLTVVPITHPTLPPSKRPQLTDLTSQPSSRVMVTSNGPTSNPSSGSSAKESIPPHSNLKPSIPTHSPTGSPILMNTNCSASSEGNVGAVSDVLPNIFVDYKYELLVNKTLLQVLNSSVADAVHDIEIAVTDILIKVLFSACSSRILIRYDKMLRSNFSTLVLGISSSPTDVTSLDSCKSMDVVNNTQCVVVDGRMTLYVSTTIALSSLLQTASNAISVGMTSGRLATSNDIIIKLRYLDPTSKIISPGSTVSSGTRADTNGIEWPIILGAFLGSGMILIIIAAVNRKKKKTKNNRKYISQSDHKDDDISESAVHSDSRRQSILHADGYSIDGLNYLSITGQLSHTRSSNCIKYHDSSEVCSDISDKGTDTVVSESISTSDESKSIGFTQGYSIEGRDLLSVAEELSNFISTNYISITGQLSHAMSGNCIDYQDVSEACSDISDVGTGKVASSMSTSVESKFIDYAQGYSIEGRDIHSVAEELSNFISTNYTDSIDRADDTDSDVFDQLPVAVESDEIQSSSSSTVMIKHLDSIESDIFDKASNEWFTESGEYKSHALERGYSIERRDLLSVAKELSNVINKSCIDSVHSVATGSDVFDDILDLSKKVENKQALFECKAIDSVDGYEIQGRSLLSLAQTVSDVISSNYVYSDVSDDASSDPFDNVSKDEEMNENSKPITNMLASADYPDDLILNTKETDTGERLNSLKNTGPICMICRKIIEGKSRRMCQCGRSTCGMMAHLICTLDKYPLPSVSHPGTPPPARFLLCREKNILSSSQSPIYPR